MKEARPREQAWHVDGAPSSASAQASKSRGEGTVDGWPASVACPQQSGDGGIKVANVVWVLKEDWVGPQSSIFSCSCCCCVLEGLPRGWVARRSVWASCDSTCANGWRRWRSLAMRVHIRRVALQSVRRSIVANSWSASCLVATVIRNVRMLES